jgi:hypothetical protein
MGSRTVSVQAGEGCAGILICCSFIQGGLVPRGNRAGGVADLPQAIRAGACYPLPAIMVLHIRVCSHIILFAFPKKRRNNAQLRIISRMQRGLCKINCNRSPCQAPARLTSLAIILLQHFLQVEGSRLLQGQWL